MTNLLTYIWAVQPYKAVQLYLPYLPTLLTYLYMGCTAIYALLTLLTYICGLYSYISLLTILTYIYMGCAAIYALLTLLIFGLYSYNALLTGCCAWWLFHIVPPCSGRYPNATTNLRNPFLKNPYLNWKQSAVVPKTSQGTTNAQVGPQPCNVEGSPSM